MGEFSLTSGDGVYMKQSRTCLCKLFFSHVDAMWEMGKHFWKWTSSLLGKGGMPWTPVELEVTVLEPLLDVEARMRDVWGEARTASLHTVLVKIPTELVSVLSLWKILFFFSSCLSVSCSRGSIRCTLALRLVVLSWIMFLNVNFVYFIREVEEERGKEVGWGRRERARDCIQALYFVHGFFTFKRSFR